MHAGRSIVCRPARRKLAPVTGHLFGAMLAMSLTLGFGGALTFGARAQEWSPSRPIRIIVGFQPSSSSDVAARIVGQKMAEELKTAVIVENRPGASSDVAARYVAAADPDGYTIFLATVANVINFAAKGQASADISSALAPLAQIGEVPNILVVHPSLDARSVDDVIRLAKASPGELAYASAGSGSALHMAAELFSAMAKVRMLHVPYQGSAAAMGDLLSGRTSLMFAPASTVLELIKAGKLRAIASTGAERSPTIPDLPTVAEQGLAGFNSSVWFGLMAPRGLRPETARTLEAAISAATKSAEARAQFSVQGIDAIPRNREAFGAYIRAEGEKWLTVIQSNGIKLN